MTQLNLHSKLQKTETDTSIVVDSLRGKRRNASHWTLADIEWNHIDHALARNNPLTYFAVAAASFVETAADLYTANLVKHFPDARVQQWLQNHWQPEELQHGLALRTYLATVWPELAWEDHYRRFLEEYSQLCIMEELESSRALEMVARCVVETGTSSFYATIQHCNDEPVLKYLAGLIRQDEVSHYNHFRHFFEEYQKEERIGRVGVARSLYKRLTKVESEDAYIGIKYAWLMRHPDEPFSREIFERINRDVRDVMAGHYPYRSALRMFLQPIGLNRNLVKYSLPLLEHATRRMMFK